MDAEELLYGKDCLHSTHASRLGVKPLEVLQIVEWEQGDGDEEET